MSNTTNEEVVKTITKKIVKDEVTMYGEIQGENACGSCIGLDNHMNKKVIPNSEIPVDYKHHSVYTDEIGKQVAKENNIEEIPYVQKCKIFEDGEKKCDPIVGFDPKDWKEVGKAREEIVEIKEKEDKQ